MDIHTNSPNLDRLDRQILHALVVDGRCPFARLAEVLDSSEQTVARRYHRLVDAGVLRVRVVQAPMDQMYDWLLRVRVRPTAADSVAGALAARNDASWVMVDAAGTEIVSGIRPRTVEARDTLFDLLERTTQINGLTTQAILHRYAGTGANVWSAFGDPLDTEQVRALTAARPRPPGVLTNPRDAFETEVDAGDVPLLDALHADGRASYAQLAAASGWPIARVTRRLHALLESGALYVVVDIANQPLGFSWSGLFWLTVAPSGLVEAAERLAALPATAFVAALSGTTNLYVIVPCRRMSDVFDFLVGEISGLANVHTVETEPIARHVKAADSLVQGSRLRTLTEVKHRD